MLTMHLFCQQTLAGEPIRKEPRKTIKEYLKLHKSLSTNPYYPFTRTEFYLAQTWLDGGLSQNVMNRIIQDMRDIKPSGAPKSESNFLRQDEIRVRSVEDIKKLIRFMPEMHEGAEWIKIRVPLSKRFKALNELSEGDGLFAYVRKDIWKVIAELFGNPRFAGLIKTLYREIRDKTTTIKNAAGETVHPLVFSEMWTGGWWKEAQVLAEIILVLVHYFFLTR
jgi:uncharacterized protein (UPF0147 family)